jgi:membrane carboxypeptidase/penicillin-binding protein
MQEEEAALIAGLVFEAKSYRRSTQGARQSGAGNGFDQ